MLDRGFVKNGTRTQSPEGRKDSVTELKLEIKR